MARRNSNVLSGDVEEARGQILEAAQSTFLHFGVAKTTMDDIAKAAGVSRPTIYRYFRDRDTLIAELIRLRSRKLFVKGTKYVLEREHFRDQIVDGLIFLVDRGRKDPLIRLIVSPEHMDLAAAVVGTSRLASDLTLEMWGPILDRARETGELRQDITNEEACEWLALVQLILVGRLDFEDPDDPAHRRLLETFMLPAFLAPGAA
ncbi:TetR/AcrR family transcriptional regulator [Nocardia aobensis]|jgi:AcrR family transcriptional regulator|uniref:TetR/AcrR family transcriptional regulator n=3 Tax=Nocardia TaxID=1817 RepID=A0ABW6PE15_9NOCA|nr:MULTISPECIES: TetR/AcrR family transcriptional regulator [Nocardia]MBF6148831.1 TetR/AcrR family transcriptional regulator [Nocardia nova]MDN2495526.1 TetR/AcrR family transcriptional regulator [Nocardia nova]NKY48400.1 TetR/AcrR family transcriptional regulator [Nocardia cerradoensis]OXR40309.1 putative HTH-type transcriptional regulator [Nocardia cerradoensis]